MNVRRHPERHSRVQLRLAKALRGALGAIAFLSTVQQAWPQSVLFPAPATEKSRILIDAATDLIALEPNPRFPDRRAGRGRSLRRKCH